MTFYEHFNNIKKELLDAHTPMSLEQLDDGIRKLKEGMTGPIASLERLRAERLQVDTWDRWYKDIPDDIRGKISLYDFQRLGECFKKAFHVEE